MVYINPKPQTQKANPETVWGLGLRAADAQDKEGPLLGSLPPIGIPYFGPQLPPTTTSSAIAYCRNLQNFQHQCPLIRV